MSSQQEEVDLRALNLKDDKASTQGTLAVRYLVRKLQEAKSTNTCPYGASVDERTS